jgi:hypothetical protein
MFLFLEENNHSHVFDSTWIIHMSNNTIQLRHLHCHRRYIFILACQLTNVHHQPWFFPILVVPRTYVMCLISAPHARERRDKCCLISLMVHILVSSRGTDDGFATRCTHFQHPVDTRNTATECPQYTYTSIELVLVLPHRTSPLLSCTLLQQQPPICLFEQAKMAKE